MSWLWHTINQFLFFPLENNLLLTWPKLSASRDPLAPPFFLGRLFSPRNELQATDLSPISLVGFSCFAQPKTSVAEIKLEIIIGYIYASRDLVATPFSPL